jgi:hypothetical protein
MVEEVESFPPEFESGLLIDREALLRLDRAAAFKGIRTSTSSTALLG